MAQDVVIAGALFSDVPQISVPDGNGTYHPFCDPSETTATAADVAEGKKFLNAAGVLTTGTGSGGGSAVIEPLSVTANGTYTAGSGVDGYSPVTVNVPGGGGGLVYETGIFEPTNDIARATVYFSKSHSTIPIMIMMSDIGDDEPSNVSEMWWAMSNWYGYTGKGTMITSSLFHYGRVDYGYRSTSGGGSADGKIITALTGTTNTSLSYWVDNTCFKPYTTSTSRYWRAGRKYKWIAVWAPTT